MGRQPTTGRRFEDGRIWEIPPSPRRRKPLALVTVSLSHWNGKFTGGSSRNISTLDNLPYDPMVQAGLEFRVITILVPPSDGMSKDCPITDNYRDAIQGNITITFSLVPIFCYRRSH